VPCGFLITTKDRIIRTANQSFSESLSRPPCALEGRCLDTLLTKASQLFFDSYVVPTVFREGYCNEILITLEADNGLPLPKAVNVRQMDDGNLAWAFVEAENRTGLFKELEAARSAVEEQREELDQLCRTDALTGLANRREFDEALKRLFKEAERSHQPLALVIMDIDNFKSINDSYGHDVGDAALQGLADILRKISRDTDFVARFGGDEFAIILPNTEAQDAEEICARFHQSISKFTCERAMTISIGISDRTQCSPIEYPLALKRADRALYTAKQAGRNATAIWGPSSASEAVGQSKPEYITKTNI